MCEQVDLPVEKVSSKRRKKLWEIGEGHHCSILGTCLRRADLKRFAKKKIFQMVPGESDYRIHLALVGIAATRNPRSRAMHKFLDERYRAAVKRYAAVVDGQDVFELWEQDLKRGAISGAYWAIMTDQSFSSETRADIYGKVHMISHDNVESIQRGLRLNEEIVNKAAMLEEVLVEERLVSKKRQDALSLEMSELRVVERNNITLAADNKKLFEKNIQLKSELTGKSLSGKMEKLKDQLIESNNRNAGLCAEMETLKKDLEDSRELYDLANDMAIDTKSKNKRLQESLKVLNKEVLAMETAMLGSFDGTCSCSSCDDQHTSRCPGPDLCGKTILYVGGLHKMVSHYKKLVENHGGRFLHHDGGKEASRNILPKMLNTADAVLCPVDCVSHDACNCVKKICKRYQKPYVMMRSSGLSSLAKGLTEIVQ